MTTRLSAKKILRKRTRHSEKRSRHSNGVRCWEGTVARNRDSPSRPPAWTFENETFFPVRRFASSLAVELGTVVVVVEAASGIAIVLDSASREKTQSSGIGIARDEPILPVVELRWSKVLRFGSASLEGTKLSCVGSARDEPTLPEV